MMCARLLGQCSTRSFCLLHIPLNLLLPIEPGQVLQVRRRRGGREFSFDPESLAFDDRVHFAEGLRPERVVPEGRRRAVRPEDGAGGGAR